MQMLLSRPQACKYCSFRLLVSFINDLSPKTGALGYGANIALQHGIRGEKSFGKRTLYSGKAFRAQVEREGKSESKAKAEAEAQGSSKLVPEPKPTPRREKVRDDEGRPSKARSPMSSTEMMGAIVRQTRQTFGDRLPQDFLSSEEYTIYERLYGPPTATSSLEDLDSLREVEADNQDSEENVLIREMANGELEEVRYDKDELDKSQHYKIPLDLEASGVSTKFRQRLAMLRDIEDYQRGMETIRHTAIAKEDSETKKDHELISQEELLEDTQEEEDMLQDPERDGEFGEDVEENDKAYEDGDSRRTHPMTAAGRFGTSPATIFLPQEGFVRPITDLLSDASNKQLEEVSLKTFGGQGLPNSTATFKRPNLKQEPIALQASQFKMGEMEGNAFMAAIMPGAYATILSTLVEVRKRLGPEWLRNLIEKPEGPRILDAGAGGAGVLAWRDMLRTEWELMHPGKASTGESVPYGKSTVVTGSAALRNRASHLLEDTSFIPRLPDYNPSQDHPSIAHQNPQPRKQYDIILAPYTLWNFKQDYMRKSQVQNLWSLLDPKGGVLILIEKGVSRGFELMAGARETLLKYHISSAGSEEYGHTVEDASGNRFGQKEKGMIIAPCTTHGKCPMYITAGRSQGRKDFCHFNQRFIRPPYLQRIVGVRGQNHEDIQYSYVAVQRGIDLREQENIAQGHSATEAAFTGYEEREVDSKSFEDPSQGPNSGYPKFNPLSLPRAILPPIKRHGHVILDLCTPAGKIERWTVTKGLGKQAYRDARKSKWGDLWALGAKTRVPRNIRVGMNKEKTRSKNVLTADDEDMDEMLFKDDLEGSTEDLVDELEAPKPKRSTAPSGRRAKTERRRLKKKSMMVEDGL